MNANELADELEEMGWLGTATMLRQQEVEIERITSKYEEILHEQQVEIEALKQVLQSIANEHVELSHDKIKWQCDDHIRWAKEALK